VGSLSGFSPKPAILLIRPQAKRLILLNLEEVIIDARYLLENEEVLPGSTFEMTSLMVPVGSCLIDVDVASNHDQPASDPPKLQPSSSPSLNFARGVQFEKDIRSKFGHSVNFIEGFRRREFILVISFGRSKFKLDVHTVSVVLQAYFGGIASLFRVKLLKHGTF
jgi:hypothetical protein